MSTYNLTFSETGIGDETLSPTDHGQATTDVGYGEEILCIHLKRHLDLSDVGVGYDSCLPAFPDSYDPRNNPPVTLGGGTGLRRSPFTYRTFSSDQGKGQETTTWYKNSVIVSSMGCH